MLKVIATLEPIHRKYRLKIGNVSEHTKSAQRITKDWQYALSKLGFLTEVSVSQTNKEKIDVVDKKKRIAYELKVSGRNTHHEFYKDLAKVLTYNEYHEDAPLRLFVFISEADGIKSLSRRLDEKFVSMIERIHGVVIRLVAIKEITA